MRVNADGVSQIGRNVRGDVVGGRDGVAPVALLDGVGTSAAGREGSCGRRASSVRIATGSRKKHTAGEKGGGNESGDGCAGEHGFKDCGIKRECGGQGQ